MAELANSQKFKTVTTNMGRNAVALAHATGTSVKVTHIAVGDGSGNPIEPNASMTELVHEVFRGTVNDVVILEDRPGQFTAELIIPQNTGGFFIREVGLFLEDGTLFAVGSTPLTEKPDLSSGAASDLIIRMIIRILDAGLIEILVDPAQVLVTRDLLERRLKEHDQSEEAHKNLMENVLKDVVTTNTSQDVPGKKTFWDFIQFKNDELDVQKEEKELSEYKLKGLRYFDKNNKRICEMRSGINPRNDLIAQIFVLKDELQCDFILGITPEGEPYTHVTSPQAGDSSSRIATTSWVQKNKTAQLVATRSTRGQFTFTGLVPGIPAYVCDKNTKEIISVILPDTDTYSLNLTEDRELEVYQ